MVGARLMIAIAYVPSRARNQFLVIVIVVAVLLVAVDVSFHFNVAYNGFKQNGRCIGSVNRKSKLAVWSENVHSQSRAAVQTLKLLDVQWIQSSRG